MRARQAASSAAEDRPVPARLVRRPRLDFYYGPDRPARRRRAFER